MHASTPYKPLPGLAPHAIELQKQLERRQKSKQDSYEIRTQYKHSDGSPHYINRLILQESPYLLQHAHNPVNWYSWSKDAFAAAKRENKPIFLSIGYSTCHWCHVMEVESFDNNEIAALLNKHFISIKMDREQHPDLDEIYMMGVQLMSGHGGWPMSNFITDEGKPFYGATYFPPAAFKDLLTQINQVWQNKKPQLLEQADSLAKEIQNRLSINESAKAVDEQVVAAALKQVLSQIDWQRGGYQGSPKFPHETMLMLLINTVLSSGNHDALKALTVSLDHMAQGGIYDQIGGGFHRYSTDENWLVPHFEKMLYNQALLSRVYSQAYAITKDPFYKLIATEILDYVLRDMTSPKHGFYSASDADSEEEEGLFFIWSTQEIKRALGKEDANLAIELWGMSAAGNFEGKNIPNLQKPLNQSALENNLDFNQLTTKLAAIKKTLYQVREKRIHPLRDDKIITSWNGLMITAFAEASRNLNEVKYLSAATNAAEFIWQKSRDQEGKLLRINLHGKSQIHAVLPDYAFLIESFISLYDNTADTQWLERAEELMAQMLHIFWDKSHGGFFNGVGDDETPFIAKGKTISDSALPSANAVAYRCLMQLAKRTQNPHYKTKESALLASFSSPVRRYPAGNAFLLLSLTERLTGLVMDQAYFASGAGKIDLKSPVLTINTEDKSLQFELEFNLKPGWHINSDKPNHNELIATALDTAAYVNSWQLDEIHYPDAMELKVEAFDKALAVFESSFVIRGKISPKTSPQNQNEAKLRVLPLRISLQACNDKMCLAPEAIELRLTF